MKNNFQFLIDKFIFCATIKLQILRRYLKMAYKITEECIACGACVDACPCGCISENDGVFVINADECVSCGACAAQCPVSAPVEE